MKIIDFIFKVGIVFLNKLHKTLKFKICCVAHYVRIGNADPVHLKISPFKILDFSSSLTTAWTSIHD